ncbi:acyltransferase family protein [Terriglobus roseus]|uniref:Peptidoglycan/LPS O-acetylase OafA/YrhL, contains acyltransferase and SGNH-hydrolase domains n=1 Tax=Terriglobus roseus TaxID=392734 RepID=A0A1G7JCN5_9BACT|nr:acyltransferase [Terriglobus roseus]SDF22727.1 Peptidoglycan/LPS O-acetylase OafA/YrhL, contains acyltransferase and SGNH-hydrolase domains [Terriglobus roseus]
MDNGSHHKAVVSFYRPQLDVVRFFAFFAVFIHHAIPRTGSGSAIEMFADAMGFGLCLFFVLSAYLITLLLSREHDATGSINMGAFYIRRILRIWPLYLLGLSIGVARAFHHGVLQEQKAWFIAALLFAGNLVFPGNILMSHLWSISIEEQFYLFFPTSCRFFGQRGMLVIACVLILLANVTLVHFAQIHADPDVTIWFNSFVQFEMFATGILLALADRWLPRWSIPMSLLVVLGCIGGWLLAAGHFHLKTMGSKAQSAASLCAGYALVAIACGLLIVAFQQLPAQRPFIYSGRISYGLYVFHLPVLAAVTSRVHGLAGSALTLILTFCVAAVSYRYFETPFLRLKRRFERIKTFAP